MGSGGATAQDTAGVRGHPARGGIVQRTVSGEHARRTDAVADDIAGRIRGYIVTELMLEDDPSALSDETSLLGSHLDSLALVQLVAFIEEEFDVTIEDAEVTANNFRTVGDIERLVRGKVQAA
jgi:acyl carrier protein